VLLGDVCGGVPSCEGAGYFRGGMESFIPKGASNVSEWGEGPSHRLRRYDGVGTPSEVGSGVEPERKLTGTAD